MERQREFELRNSHERFEISKSGRFCGTAERSRSERPSSQHLAEMADTTRGRRDVKMPLSVNPRVTGSSKNENSEGGGIRTHDLRFRTPKGLITRSFAAIGFDENDLSANRFESPHLYVAYNWCFPVPHRNLQAPHNGFAGRYSAQLSIGRWLITLSLFHRHPRSHLYHQRYRESYLGKLRP